MTPKEKAQELVNKFLLYSDDGDLKNKYWKIRNAKQCGLIAVDELIKQERKTDDYYEIGSYWIEVKQEIELL